MNRCCSVCGDRTKIYNISKTCRCKSGHSTTVVTKHVNLAEKLMTSNMKSWAVQEDDKSSKEFEEVNNHN